MRAHSKYYTKLSHFLVWACDAKLRLDESEVENILLTRWFASHACGCRVEGLVFWVQGVATVQQV